MFLSCFFGINGIQIAVGETWGAGSPWSDRRAEVAFYEAERLVGGKPCVYKEQLLTRREEIFSSAPSSTDQKVTKQKKQVVFRFYDVEKYDGINFPISSLVGVLTQENATDIIRLSVGLQDWTGNTLTIYQPPSDQKGWTWSQFKEAEPVANQTGVILFTPGDLFDAQLPLMLRSLPFKKGYSKSMRLWDSVANSTQTVFEPVAGRVTVDGEEIVRCRVGSLPCWVVTVHRGDKKDSYWLEKKSPHILVKMVKYDGRKRLLTGRARWSYWDPRLPKPRVLD